MPAVLNVVPRSALRLARSVRATAGPGEAVRSSPGVLSGKYLNAYIPVARGLPTCCPQSVVSMAEAG